MSKEDKRPSRRNAWIQKRWKSAMQSVRTIGFKTFEEILQKDDDEKDHSHERDHSQSRSVRRSATPNCHYFLPLDQDVDDEERSLCYVCEEPIDKDDETCDGDRGVKCQNCRMVTHDGCQLNLTSTNCQSSVLQLQHLTQSKSSKHKQKSSTPDELAASNDNNIGANVDPIYLALKKGNKMATQRKQSVADCSRGSSQTRDATPSSDLTSRSSFVNGKSSNGGGSPSFNAFADNTNSTSSSHLLSNGKANSSSATWQNLEDKSEKRGSAPNLVAQKSVDSQDEGLIFKKPAVQKPTASAAVRRAPKLDSKMKSLSLDCPDAATARKNSMSAAAVGPLSSNRHALRVPPCKYNSFESADDTARSSTSCSPCPSSACGSTLALPSNSFAVTHDYYAKFPEEIDLRVGERVILLDNSDPDWWQGHNVSGRLGIFPATCVAHIHNNEQVMQIVQNVCLWVGNKNHRMYRDQIVFAQMDEEAPEGLIIVRTERDFRINCPVQYLMSLE